MWLSNLLDMKPHCDGMWRFYIVFWITLKLAGRKAPGQWATRRDWLPNFICRGR
jgi:hypothetical protein